MFRVLSGEKQLRTVEFSYTSAAVRQVAVVGSFNDWDPALGTMTSPNEGGVYRAVIRLKPGYYEYKFVIDGVWELDFDNPDFTANDFGTLNSVLNLE